MILLTALFISLACKTLTRDFRSDHTLEEVAKNSIIQHIISGWKKRKKSKVWCRELPPQYLWRYLVELYRYSFGSKSKERLNVRRAGLFILLVTCRMGERTNCVAFAFVYAEDISPVAHPVITPPPYRLMVNLRTFTTQTGRFSGDRKLSGCLKSNVRPLPT